MENAYFHSENLRAGSPFPYLATTATEAESQPAPPGFRVMHWHQDFQFVLVQRGALSLRTLAGGALLRAGQGAFLNAGVIHQLTARPGCQYRSFLFPPYLAEFYPGSGAGRCVEQMAQSPGLPFLLLDGSAPWHQRALNLLGQLADIGNPATPVAEYEVLTLLAQLCLELLKNAGFPEPGREESPRARRMASFLQFIEAHFGEPVTLEALAASGNVSKSECLRCFQALLGATPMEYLLEFRLSKASQLLAHTQEPVGQIASACGFSHFSYFAKRFRGKMGCSPREYRRRCQVSLFHAGETSLHTPDKRGNGMTEAMPFLKM